MAAPTWLTDAQTRWQTALTARLAPTIGIDPGARATGIVVRAGARLLAAAIVENPEPATALGAYAIPVSPEYGYARHVISTVRSLMSENDDRARCWWTHQGHTLSAMESPWLIGAEKINLPRESLSEGYRVGREECLSIVAATAVLNAVLVAFDGQIIPALPYRCDTRWERRYGGTGDPFQYFPAPILAAGGLRSAEDLRGRTLDHRDFRDARVKDAASAWSIASDVAADYQDECVRLHGRLLPPAQAPDAVAAVWAARRRSLDSDPRTWRALDARTARRVYAWALNDQQCA